MLRAGADIATYYDTGTIVNQKGYVVSKNLHAGTYLARALGFYPEAASSANAGIAVLTRVSNYRKDIAAEFYGKYVAASLAQDSEKVQEVRELVEQWNEDTEGTGLEISNFTKNAQRALREARRPAGDRFLRTLPISARAEAQRTLDILAPDGMEGE
jgi:preprotein translocase subunit Sss1